MYHPEGRGASAASEDAANNGAASRKPRSPTDAFVVLAAAPPVDAYQVDHRLVGPHVGENFLELGGAVTDHQRVGDLHHLRHVRPQPGSDGPDAILAELEIGTREGREAHA